MTMRIKCAGPCRRCNRKSPQWQYIFPASSLTCCAASSQIACVTTVINLPLSNCFYEFKLALSLRLLASRLPASKRLAFLLPANFCHTTPILVHDPFLALDMTVNFPPWKPFFDFPFRSYSCFRKKIRLTCQKVFPHPTVGFYCTVKALALSAHRLDKMIIEVKSNKIV